MPIGPKRIPLFDHIAELRRRIIVIVAVLFIGSIALYSLAPQAFELMMAPIKPLLGNKGFIVLGPFDKFTLQFKIGIYLSLILGSPIIIYQVLAFFLPALTPKERKFFFPIFIAMVVLFLSGVAFAYFQVLYPGFQWMLAQGGFVEVQPRADQWMTAVMMFLLGFGTAFELPVVVFALMVLRIVPYAKLRAQWRVVYVILMVVASVATPDWSPVNMLVLFLTLTVLYEGSMLAARIVLRKRIEAERLADLEFES
jgi:sec-independent protein translocase protein TatC